MNSMFYKSSTATDRLYIFKVYIYSEIYSIQAVKLYTFSLFVCLAMCQGDEFIYSVHSRSQCAFSTF
jgi:hypothetical protein